MKNKIYSKLHLTSILGMFLLPIITLAQSDSLETKIPKYVLDDFESNVGVWITDNSKYKSEAEPYDAYGLEWRHGLGNKTLYGRLFCLQAGKDIGSVWEFFMYWDPAMKSVQIIQTGSDGTVGKGTNERQMDGTWKSKETFVSPDGNTWVSGHEAKLINGERQTQSFNIVKGEWQKRRFYIWKRKN